MDREAYWLGDKRSWIDLFFCISIKKSELFNSFFLNKSLLVITCQ
jgi:hypothetical protein